MSCKNAVWRVAQLMLDVLVCGDKRKTLGAYYTNQKVAGFLLQAIRLTPNDRVLEPSAGVGAFVEAWHRVVPAPSRSRLVACDISTEAVATGRQQFPNVDWRLGNFFDIPAGRWGSFDVIIGNPPFVRAHRVDSQIQTLALYRAQEAGVMLPRSTSLWVPFLIHATQHLAQAGRLAVVAPLELLYARYAAPFRAYLCQRFEAVRIIVPERPLFSNVSQRAILLLARGWGSTADQVDIVHVDHLGEITADTIWTASAQHLPSAEWIARSPSGTHVRLSAEVRSLYERLSQSAIPLSHFARLTIGYVSGESHWFHLSADEVTSLNLSHDVQLTLRRGTDLRSFGLSVKPTDHHRLAQEGAHWVFAPRHPLSKAARARIRHGEQLAVPNRYKCQYRNPWWRIPDIRPHDMAMGVVSTHSPRLVATGLPATNSLLVGDITTPINPKILAAASLTSFARLSAELVGHPLGGGALKLEPIEAKQWLLLVVDCLDERILDRIDAALGSGALDQALALADQAVLAEGLGLSARSIQLLQDAVCEVQRRRLRVSKRFSDSDINIPLNSHN